MNIVSYMITFKNDGRILSRNISTPTLRSGKLPPVYFFPTGSPLHDTYNDLLRKATAKSRSSKSGSIWDGNDSPIKVYIIIINYDVHGYDEYIKYAKRLRPATTIIP
jgi:hypothetical protein